MYQHLGTHGVTQKIVTQSPTRMGIINQTGNLSQDKAIGFKLDHTQHWLESSEWITGYLWFGGRSCRQQCGFTHIRISNNTNIGDKPQLQNNRFFLSRF